MAAVREYLIYGVDDEHKHLWPIHYHLLKNDFLAAMDCVRRGANPLVEDCDGTSAVALCYRLFFNAINKSLNSTASLCNRFHRSDGECTPMASPQKRHEPKETPELHGMADYHVVSDSGEGVQQQNNGQLFTSYVEFVIANPKLSPASSTQNVLLRRAKGLLAVLRSMAEREDMLVACKNVLMESIHLLEYPSFYASVMDYLFLNSRAYTSGMLQASDVKAARQLWRAASAKDAKLNAVTEFITQISAILGDLCGVFHVDIYSQSLGKCSRLYPGHDRQLQLVGLDHRTVEMLAHMAFVTNKPMLFDVMVLQDTFLQVDRAFKWDELLSHLVGESGHYKAFMEPLMRRSLRNNVEKRMGTSGVVSNAAVF